MFKKHGQTNPNNDKKSFFEIFKRIHTRGNLTRWQTRCPDTNPLFQNQISKKSETGWREGTKEFNLLEIRSNVTVKSPKKIGTKGCKLTSSQEGFKPNHPFEKKEFAEVKEDLQKMQA
jgi:hypothetical protein